VSYQQEFDYPLMGRVSALVGCPVYRVPDGHGTCSDGSNIWLEHRYAEKIRALIQSKTIPLRAWPTAQAVYFLLHEKGHVKQKQMGLSYGGTASEIDANTQASVTFRPFLKTCELSDFQVNRLWRSLPDYYRKPENV